MTDRVLPRSQRALTDGEKAAILLMRAKHMAVDQIATAVERKPGTIRKFLSTMEKLASESGVDFDWKEDLKMKSIDAVRAGVEDDTDNYKRGTLGLGTLKGLGVLAGDGVQINQLIASVPPEWASRYLSNDEDRP